MTVENLTSFHRLEREHIFYLFLSGYHTRTKQALLQQIARENPGLSWHHFGDLDPDGLAIAGASDPKDGTAVSAVRDGCAGIAAVSDICETIGSTRSGEGGSDD